MPAPPAKTKADDSDGARIWASISREKDVL